MNTHPEFGTLLDWLEGRLEPAAAAEVTAQVADGDAQTRRTVDWLRGFLATAAAMPLYEPPPIVAQRLSQHFARWSRAQAELDRRPAEMPARLLFDSRQDLALAGVRAGAGDGDAVHLAYATDAGDLLLDVYEQGGGLVRVDGQVLLAETQGAPAFEASVIGPGFTLRTSDGDDLGRFSLTGVPAVRCELRATNGLVTIVAGLDLEPGGDQP